MESVVKLTILTCHVSEIQIILYTCRYMYIHTYIHTYILVHA